MLHLRVHQKVDKGEEVRSLFRSRKQNNREQQDRGLVAKLRRSTGELLDNPTVRREVRRGVDRLANDPRVRHKVGEWVSRAARRLRRR
jgi:hypothetical protein